MMTLTESNQTGWRGGGGGDGGQLLWQSFSSALFAQWVEWVSLWEVFHMTSVTMNYSLSSFLLGRKHSVMHVVQDHRVGAGKGGGTVQRPRRRKGADERDAKAMDRRREAPQRPPLTFRGRPNAGCTRYKMERQCRHRYQFHIFSQNNGFQSGKHSSCENSSFP